MMNRLEAEDDICSDSSPQNSPCPPIDSPDSDDTDESESDEESNDNKSDDDTSVTMNESPLLLGGA
jgi:hypothetical protein